MVMRVVMGLVVTALFVAFTVSGGSKLMSAPDMVAMIEAFSLPAVSLYVVGVVEVCLALGVVLRRTRVIAAGGMIALMTFAAGFHLNSGYETNMVFMNLMLGAFAFAVSIWTQFGPVHVIPSND